MTNKKYKKEVGINLIIRKLGVRQSVICTSTLNAFALHSFIKTSNCKDIISKESEIYAFKCFSFYNKTFLLFLCKKKKLLAA